MKRSGWRLASLAAVACLWAGPARAAHFVPPADGPVPFHRDQLPIDVNTMTTLSRQLVTLAGAQQKNEAGSLQTVARLLALAQGLDPQNREAEDMVSRLLEKKKVETADAQMIDSARIRAWQVQVWLDSEAAGAEGKALAKCLLDVLAAVDPENPKAEAARNGGPHGAWAGWVAPPAEFEDQLVKNVTPKPDEQAAVKPADVGAGGVSIRLKQATVHTPLWVVEPSAPQKSVLKLVAVTIKAEDAPQGQGAQRKLQVRFQSQGQDATSDDQLRQMSDHVLLAVKSLHGNLPPNGKEDIVIGSGYYYYTQLNHDMISSAEAALVDATMSGEEPDATVIGVVGEDGSFKSPPRFWELLRSLANGPGGRLVVPRESAPVMLSVLAVEDPDFFFKYEVIAASNVKELVDRCAKRNTSPLDEASAKFHEVRAKMGTMQVGEFVANRFVRQRLAEVVQAFPDHLSARMLAIQGAGERPTRLPRAILAAEIRKAVLPVFPYASKSYSLIDLASLEAAYEACRKSLDALGRYEEMRDRPLADHAAAMLVSVRTFMRAKRASRGGMETLRAENAVSNAFDEMAKDITSFQRELKLELGELPAPRDDADQPKN